MNFKSPPGKVPISPPDMRRVNEQISAVAKADSTEEVSHLSETKTTLAKEIIALRENQEVLQNQIAEQHEYLEYIATNIKKIKRYILFSYIGEVLKLLLIVVPLIMAYFAFKPYFSQAIGGWQNIQASFQELSGSGSSSSLDIINLLK
jgi:hypothetical protein